MTEFASSAIFNTSTWTNVQGLRTLQHTNKTDPDLAKKEVARQFEALLIQTLLKSMRDANSQFMGELSDSDQQEMYTDLYDKQLSMVLSQSGMGLSGAIESWLDRASPKAVEQTGSLPTPAPHANAPAMKTSQPPSSPTQPLPRGFETALDFVKGLWGPAKAAAALLGADPKLLLAQAALETNWGKQIIPHQTGGSSFNLFNIKAGTAWQNRTAEVRTLEQHGDTLVREKAVFRAYDSFESSFKDFVQLLKTSPRYQDAVARAGSPGQFAEALQSAHYATDPQYAEKIMSIYHSKSFNGLFETANLV